MFGLELVEVVVAAGDIIVVVPILEFEVFSLPLPIELKDVVESCLAEDTMLLSSGDEVLISS